MAAIQVADRFHLLQNLGETLDQVFGAHSQAIKAVAVEHSLSNAGGQDGTTVVLVSPPQPTTKEQHRAEQRRTRRLTNYQQVWDLHHQGWSAPAVAKQIGIGRTTVFRYSKDLRLVSDIIPKCKNLKHSKFLASSNSFW